MTHSYTIRVCHITHACVWHEIYLGLYDSIMCHNMMHSYLWHDSFIHVPCLLHACDVTGEIWHIHVCDVTLMCEKHLWRGVDFLQHTAHLSATYCNVLQHAATHCNTLQHATPCCNTLQHCNTPYPIYGLRRTVRVIIHEYDSSMCRCMSRSILDYPASLFPPSLLSRWWSE